MPAVRATTSPAPFTIISAFSRDSNPRVHPTAFAANYVDRVEDHLERLRVRCGIDFGRHFSLVERMYLPDHLYARLVNSTPRTHDP